jgi:hypothetical protein
VSPEVWLLLDKAREDLAAMKDVMATPRPWRAATDAYYAMFHAGEALLLSRGIETSSHAATQAAFGREFSRPAELDPRLHRHLINAFEKRTVVDYEVSVKLEPGDIELVARQAEEFVAAAAAYLERGGSVGR